MMLPEPPPISLQRLEKLIAIRDGLPRSGATRNLALGSPEAIRDLAEVRLLALLMAPPRAAPASGASQPSPETMIRYLRNELSLNEAQDFEARVRGQVEALDLLLALKDALYRPLRQDRRTPPPPQPTERVDLGVIRILRNDGQLRFTRQDLDVVQTVPDGEDVETLDAVTSQIARRFEMRERGPSVFSRFDGLRLVERIGELRSARQEVERIFEDLSSLEDELLLARATPDRLFGLEREINEVQKRLRAVDRLLERLEHLVHMRAKDATLYRAESERAKELEETTDCLSITYFAQEVLDVGPPAPVWLEAVEAPGHGVRIEVRAAECDPSRLAVRVHLEDHASAVPPELTLLVPGSHFTVLRPGPDGVFLALPPRNTADLLIHLDRMSPPK